MNIVVSSISALSHFISMKKTQHRIPRRGPMRRFAILQGSIFSGQDPYELTPDFYPGIENYF